MYFFNSRNKQSIFSYFFNYIIVFFHKGYLISCTCQKASKNTSNCTGANDTDPVNIQHLSLNLCTFPVAVLGRLSTNSIHLGCLYGAALSRTNFLSSSSSPEEG